MSYRDILHAQLRIDEGVRDRAYLDAVGKVTVGVGHNLTDKPLRAEVVDLIQRHDEEDAERDARAVLPAFDTLSDARKAVVVNMAFNLGAKRFAQFTEALRAIREERWNDAAIAMLASKWAEQVGARAQRLARSMREDTP